MNQGSLITTGQPNDIIKVMPGMSRSPVDPLFGFYDDGIELGKPGFFVVEDQAKPPANGPRFRLAIDGHAFAADEQKDADRSEDSHKTAKPITASPCSVIITCRHFKNENNRPDQPLDRPTAAPMPDLTGFLDFDGHYSHQPGIAAKGMRD